MIRKSILSTAVYPMAVLAILALPAAAQTKSSSCCASKAKVAKVETPAPAASDAQGQAVANATDKVVAAKSSACAIQAKAQTCTSQEEG